jgi:hypothetical protein
MALLNGTACGGIIVCLRVLGVRYLQNRSVVFGNKEDFAVEAAKIAGPIANVRGLLWKIWIDNPGSRCAGGIYLFEDEASLKAFVDGPIAVGISRRLEFLHVDMRAFDVLEAPSLVTRGPVSTDGFYMERGPKEC